MVPSQGGHTPRAVMRCGTRSSTLARDALWARRASRSPPRSGLPRIDTSRPTRVAPAGGSGGRGIRRGSRWPREGRPSSDRDYVWACRQLGYQGSDLTVHPAQVRDWYAHDDGLDLRHWTRLRCAVGSGCAADDAVAATGSWPPSWLAPGRAVVQGRRAKFLWRMNNRPWPCETVSPRRRRGWHVA